MTAEHTRAWRAANPDKMRVCRDRENARRRERVARGDVTWKQISGGNSAAYKQRLKADPVRYRAHKDRENARRRAHRVPSVPPGTPCDVCAGVGKLRPASGGVLCHRCASGVRMLPTVTLLEAALMYVALR